MGIYHSSGRSSDPLGFFSVLIGLVGAAAALVLWAYQFDPNGSLVSSVAAKLGPGFALGDDLVLTAFLCGVFCVALAVVGALGGKLRGSAVFSIVLGVVALSYPLLTKLDLVTRPLVQHFR